MNITLYSCSAIPEIIDKTSYMTQILDVPLKEGAPNQAIELMNPSLIVTMNRYPSSANYAKVDGRYYFILDWVVQNPGLYLLNLHLDVLMTYRSAISNLDVIMERSYTGNQPMLLPDPMVPISSERSLELVKGSTGFDGTEATGAYVMVVSQAGYDAIGTPSSPPYTPDIYGPTIGASTLGAYILDKEKLFQLAGDLSVTELLEKLAYALVGNPADAIITLHWLPGIKNRLQTSEVDVHLKLGNFSFNGVLGTEIVTKAIVDERAVVSMGRFRLNQSIGFPSFLDYSPHTQAELYLPFYGMVRIAPELYPSGYVRVYYTINVVKRTCVIGLYNAEDDVTIPLATPVEQFTTTFGTSVPFTTQSNEDMLSRLVTMASGAALATATFATAPVGPAVAGAAMSTSNALRTGPAVENLVNQVNPNNLPSQDRNISVGGMDAESGMMGSLYPILRVTRSVIPESYGQPNNDIYRAVGHPDYEVRNVGLLGNGSYFKISGLANLALGPPRVSSPIPRYAWDEILKLLKDGVFK